MSAICRGTVFHSWILNSENCYKALVPSNKVNDCLRECLPVFITWQLPESTQRDLFVGCGEQSEPLQSLEIIRLINYWPMRFALLIASYGLAKSLFIVWSGSKQPRFKIFIFWIVPPNPSHTARQPRSTSHQPFPCLMQALLQSLQCRHKHRDSWRVQMASRQGRKKA